MYFILQKALPLINAGSFRYLRKLTGFKDMQSQKARRSKSSRPKANKTIFFQKMLIFIHSMSHTWQDFQIPGRARC